MKGSYTRKQCACLLLRTSRQSAARRPPPQQPRAPATLRPCTACGGRRHRVAPAHHVASGCQVVLLSGIGWVDSCTSLVMPGDADKPLVPWHTNRHGSVLWPARRHRSSTPAFVQLKEGFGPDATLDMHDYWRAGLPASTWQRSSSSGCDLRQGTATSRAAGLKVLCMLCVTASNRSSGGRAI